jgi:hypothetical protein
MNSPSTTSKRTAVMTRPAGPLKCNLAMAARFLHGLDPDADAFTFQTRDDRGYNLELSYALHSRLDTCARRLHVLNHYGAGVFVTVNKTNGQGRALQQIKRVRGVWQQRTGQGQPLQGFQGAAWPRWASTRATETCGRLGSWHFCGAGFLGPRRLLRSRRRSMRAAWARSQAAKVANGTM